MVPKLRKDSWQCNRPRSPLQRPSLAKAARHIDVEEPERPSSKGRTNEEEEGMNKPLIQLHSQEMQQDKHQKGVRKRSEC